MRLRITRWPTLLLLASLAFTTLGVVEATRSIRSQRTVAEHALRDYAGFAAWSYQQHLRERLSMATHEVLGAVNHGEGVHARPPIPDASDLAHYLQYDARCRCHRTFEGPPPLVFFGYVLGSDTLGVGVNTHPDPDEGWEVDRPIPTRMEVSMRGRVDTVPVPADRKIGYSTSERAWINDTLTRHIRATRDLASFPLVAATREGDTRMLVYTLMQTSWGDTVVYGAEYSRATFRALLEKVMLDRNLLPATFTRGQTTRQVMRLQVSDLRGAALFESDPGSDAAWRLDEATRLPTSFGDLEVRAQIRPEMASALVIGGLPQSRVPLFLGLLAVAVALSLVAFAQMRRAGELARMRGDFVENISHELRTPLAQMRVYLETLRLGRFTTDEQRAWSIANAERETRRLEHLVERVLRFSRSARLGDQDAPEPTDIAAEAARIVDEFRPLADARKVRLAMEADAVPTLALRPNALRHVLVNLLDNAVKYGPTGQTVVVRVRSVDAEVRIEVIDGGPGVPAAERDAVWRAYRRGGATGHVSGNGIGLAVVRDVVAQHAGRAWISDAPGDRGASFNVAFPVSALG